MTNITKVIGWLVLVITEILITWAFITSTDKASLVSYQVIIFCTVWGAVGVKNFIDMKRDVSECQTKNPEETSEL